MTEIHSFDSIKRTQSQPTTKQNQQYYTKTPQAKPDTVELSTKENNSDKKSIKKYVLAGLAIAGTTLAVVLGLKHMNAKKALELEEKAKQEAERLRQQAEEAQRQAEEKLKQEAEEAQRRAEELAREEARKAKEKAQEEARIAQEQVEQKARETEAIKDTEPTQEIQTKIVEPEPKVETPHQEIKQEVEPEITEKPEIKTEEPKSETVIAETEPAETVKTPKKTEVEAPEIKEEVKAEPKEEIPVQETKTEVKVEQPKEEIKPEEIKPETKSEEIQAPKTKPIRPQGLSQAMNTALDFGEDLTDLVNGKNATPEEIQKLVQKHYKNDNIHIHGMSEYDGMGINAKGKAATTRPFFNEDGKLEKIDIYVPDLDYGDSNAVMEFISKTTHEMTHVSQFIAKDGSNAESLKPTMEGRCLNYIQKVITDRYTEKLPMDMLKSLFKEEGFVPRTAEDVNKFFDRPNSDLSLEKIGEVTKLGTDEASRKQNVNIIFDVLFDPMMEQMAPRDPNVQSLIRKHGGYEGFKAEMKRICAETFKNEQEAYRAEEMMRQELSGNVGKDTNYGIIHKIMGICADSLG